MIKSTIRRGKDNFVKIATLLGIVNENLNVSASEFYSHN